MKSARQIRIQVAQSDPVVEWVAQEAGKYIHLMTRRSPGRLPSTADDDEGCLIQIGTVDQFPRIWPDVKAAGQDIFADEIFVKAGSGRVILSGLNSRSVLFALYRWLEELGCRWLRPGPMGETIPRIADPLRKVVRLQETPSYRHRCICIEGSCSRQHVLDLVDYAAKRGFNAYFLQFRNSYTFFDHWYREERQAGGPPAAFSVEEAEAIHGEIKRAALDRGLLLHMVGHGWTCEPFGIGGTEWRPTTQAIPETTKRFFAQVGGRRELWGGIPLNTQLCYGNPVVRDKMAQAVAEYAGTHPEEQVIHVWLADGSNNNCECAACRRHRPSDLYVDLLNEIDRRLSKRKLGTRIVFLAYVDLLWAPVRAKIENPDRFILMFAPITRSYSRPFGGGAAAPSKPVGPFVRNKLVFPTSPEANLGMLKGWRRAFKGECVDFDYHLWRDWVFDPGQMQISRVIYEDVRNLAPLGMNGFISCQAQRLAFPTGLPLHLLGKTLWDARDRFDDLVRSYFGDLYGRQGTRVRRLMEEISQRIDPSFLRGEKKRPLDFRRAAETYAALAGFLKRRVRGFLISSPGDAVHAYSRKILCHYIWYITSLADLYAKVSQKDSQVTEALAAFEQGMKDRLMELHPVLDTWMASAMVRHVVASAGLPYREKIWVTSEPD
jgi:hypothetical protein